MNLLDLDDLMELLNPSPFGMMGMEGEGTQLPYSIQRLARKPAFSGPPEISGDETHWTPLMDVCDSETERLIHIDLPGVKKEEITIELKEEHKLWVTGSRKVRK